jgi:sporulation integral membrane protein YlbJ
MQRLILPLCLFFIICMLIFPEESYTAAQDGLILWWQVVLPALLPFFMIAEILLASNSITYIGFLLAPVMRPIFRLPGEAALAIVMGYSSGFPTGAAVTAGLRQKGLVSKEEGERLIAFTNNASPLFITISVAAGILAEPSLGYLLLLIHYGSNLLIGFFLRFSAKSSAKINKKIQPLPPRQELLPLGRILKNAAQKAGRNVVLIGCYMVFFSVLTQILQSSGLTNIMINLFHLPPDIGRSLSLGIWEMTLGINAIGASTAAPGLKLAICAALLAWGGFSVQAQVAAMVSDTDIGIKTYIVSRIIHVVISFAAIFLLLRQWPLTKLASTMEGADSLLTATPFFIFIGPILFLLAAAIIGKLFMLKYYC